MLRAASYNRCLGRSNNRRDGEQKQSARLGLAATSTEPLPANVQCNLS